ncbi:hypothetical protein [Brevibacterium jeotgali]|uniref:Uncharacterized protein n=1 Tax=Brevibacterium jeotgali TaxID=1262550 RepID=A0A2H1L457_9MICO|nr:hypothetical protein [Brevibacterium jeotgali]TWC02401.1 hypothetical protein FB108_1077 [Brevibacterium jeotgali]SMY11193.1 hypothetical protein BJEO58_00776 [Brevibacterium jeotgali]
MPDDKRPPLSSSATNGGSPAEPSAVHDPEGTPEPETPMQKPRGDDGFGLWYRFFFRFQYTLLHVIGPPRLTASMDPRTRLKQDYDRRKALNRQWKAAKAKS